MRQGDVINIGPYKYTVMKVKDKRVLVSWIESTGIEKEMWFILRQNNNLKKVA